MDLSALSFFVNNTNNGFTFYNCLVSSKQSKVKWIPPSNWTGPSSVLYYSFDCSEGLVLMEGTEATPNSVPLVFGKVGFIMSVLMKIISVKSKF